jgi:hypothetical protein
MKYGQNYEETFNPLAKICPRLCDWWHKTPRDGYSMPRSCFAMFVCGGGRGTTRCSYRPSDRCRSSFLVWCFRTGLVPQWGLFRFWIIFGGFSEGVEAFVRTGVCASEFSGGGFT